MRFTDLTPPLDGEFALIDPAEWEGVEPPPREWMMEGWLPRNRAAYLTGAGGAGKSLLGQQLATCIALGLPFLGVNTSQAPAIYLTAEDDQDELQRRQRSICRATGIPENELHKKLFLVSLFGQCDNEMFSFDSGKGMVPQPAWGKLQKTALGTQARFVVLDNVSHIFAGSEIDRAQVTAFASALNALALDMEGTVLLIGHPNKQGDSYSGSTAWENAFRARLYFDAPKAEGVDPDLRQLSLPKANYARKGTIIDVRWHDGALICEKDLPPTAAAEIRKLSAANAENERFLACLGEMTRQQRQVSEKPNAANYAPKVFEQMPEAKGIGRPRLAAAMERLFRTGDIERGFLWRNTSEGKDIHGLRKISDKSSDNLPETASDKLRKPAENDRKQCAVYPTDILSGGANDPGPPDYQTDELDWDAIDD